MQNALALLGSGGPGSTWLGLDTFTGADGTDLTAHTPNLGPAWTVPLGSFQLQDGRAVVTTVDADAGFALACADFGHADVSLSLTLESDATGLGEQAGLVARYTDPSNFWTVTYTVDAANFELDEVNGDLFITRGAASLSPGGFGANTATLVCSGASITVTIAGPSGSASFAYATATTFQTATVHGFLGVTPDHDAFATWEVTAA